MKFEAQIKRAGEFIALLDTHEAFRVMKLTSLGSLQFLFMDAKVFVPTFRFDLHSDAALPIVNDYRRELTKILPGLLLKKHFTIDTKASQFTSSEDQYVIFDEKNKQFKLEVIFNYIDRKHVMNPEYFAVKNNLFEDIHLYSLSNLENFAIYIRDVIMQKQPDTLLNYLVVNKKILPQQYPFIKKMLLFYLSFTPSMTQEMIKFRVERTYQAEPQLKDFLLELTTFNEKEVEFITRYHQGQIVPSLIYGDMIAKNLENHPRVISMNKGQRG